MNLLKTDTVISLIEKENSSVKNLIAEMSVGLTIEKAISSPKIFQVKKRYGMEILIKILCVIIKSFCDSIRASKTMDAADILECADLIAETYTHDSIKDIIMALKQAKKNGKNFYNSISTPVIFEIISEYMNNKIAFIEKREADFKSQYTGDTRTEMGTILAMNERIEDQKEKNRENKNLKDIQREKKEVKKLSDFIEKNIGKVK